MTFAVLTDREAIRAAWRELLPDLPAAADDVYYHPDYLALNAWMEGGSPVVGVYRGPDGAVWHPAMRRPLPAVYDLPGRDDLVSAYGFGGPLVIGRRETVLPAFAGAWAAYCVESAVVAEFIRFHPLLENHADCLAGVHQVKDVVWFDLTQSTDALSANLHPQKRRSIKKAAQAGLSLSSDWRYFEDFQALYAQSMTQKDAGAFYHFPPALFETIASDFPRGNVHLLSALQGDRVLSAVLLLSAGERAHYFLGANHPDARAVHSSAWLLWQSALFSRRQGFRQYVLGGGLARDDSLFQFKRQLSPRTAPYRIGTRVYDTACYRGLIETYDRKWPGKSAAYTSPAARPLFFYRDIPPDTQ